MLSTYQIKNYVPRHIRLGLSLSEEVPFESYQDVIENVPVVDDSGSVVFSKQILKSVPSGEVMKKYKVSNFRLSALIKAGVPLKVVNVNSSNSATIEQLVSVCKSIDSADSYVNRVLEQKKERESWFSIPDDSAKIE